eukprot:CAMPEP_0174238744 /NCGR_PEP_ID=MMETSP0417-20130205/12330_1 /TAXON_ID=242541 /ORGANISM="Mayorella sp, Strain BSH-02190019" /LENGTH=84 /DNA_ID=CAMNT_0015317621 /DNA_START=157 /DNA_END=411 /DNA_ORIENTATION=+
MPSSSSTRRSSAAAAPRCRLPSCLSAAESPSRALLELFEEEAEGAADECEVLMAALSPPGKSGGGEEEEEEEDSDGEESVEFPS